jgi:tetratricopeptide (TPR) repeat protein
MGSDRKVIPDIAMLLARLYRNIKQPKTALKILKKVKNGDKNPLIAEIMGHAHYDLDQLNEAKALFMEVLKTHDSPRTLRNLAMILMKEGDYSGSIPYLNRLLEIHPDNISTKKFLLKCCREVLAVDGSRVDIRHKVEALDLDLNKAS